MTIDSYAGVAEREFMDISFKRQGRVVAGRLSINQQYAAKEIDWRLDWRLRFQISVTAIGKHYGLGAPRALGAGRFGSTNPNASISVEGDMVTVEFILPDC